MGFGVLVVVLRGVLGCFGVVVLRVGRDGEKEIRGGKRGMEKEKRDKKRGIRK